jgi:hypothetical protein
MFFCNNFVNSLISGTSWFKNNKADLGLHTVVCEVSCMDKYYFIFILLWQRLRLLKYFKI